MEKPIIRPEHVVPLLDKRFIRVFDLQYAPGKHYYDATRHTLEDLTCLKGEEEAKSAVADAVTCFPILLTPDDEPRLLLSWEYRYPCGRFLLSPPAGLVDKEDLQTEQPLFSAAKRELKEETGIDVGEGDDLQLVSPLVYSSPGMTDESNALLCAVIHLDSLDALTQQGAQGSECFDGFELLTRDEARRLLRQGRDPKGDYYSVYTWTALCWFAADLWKE